MRNPNVVAYRRRCRARRLAGVCVARGLCAGPRRRRQAAPQAAGRYGDAWVPPGLAQRGRALDKAVQPLAGVVAQARGERGVRWRVWDMNAFDCKIGQGEESAFSLRMDPKD